MLLRLLSVPVLLAVATPALAASDLVTSITPPSGTYVYQTGRYYVTVTNNGNATANSSSVVIQLPVTHTSPQVYVMGTVGAKSASCTTSGTTLSCSLGAISKRRSTSVYFDIAMPESTSALTITATAATTSSENSTANNGASHTASLNNYAVSWSGPATITNDHCTGTTLTSYFECTLFPSSISSHDVIFNTNGTIDFSPVDSSGAYTGTWTQASADHLAFSYYEYGTLVAEFEGWGVSTSCWEGITTFPGSSYVSPYHVCAP